ncbi:hypothetical protein, partial [Macrococcoides bohemicum]|uniref:hypothetical protein n=1 Tax=Macrococcoides bohemicum TaxID=1903056 RepID=UPI0028A5BF30
MLLNKNELVPTSFTLRITALVTGHTIIVNPAKYKSNHTNDKRNRFVYKNTNIPVKAINIINCIN